ncbi:MAG: murein biosynthesis integral membrane protein MurJ [Chloroflexota bacterium]
MPRRAGVSVARAAAIIMAGNVLSRLLGFLRDQTQAIIFGINDTVSGYITALTVQTSIYDLLVSGVISAAFIPVFSRLRDDEEEFATVAGTVLTVTALVMGLAMLVTELFPAQVIVLYMNDPARHPGGYHAALGALRLMAPAILFLGLSGVLTALLYAKERFIFPAFTPVVFNASIVCGALALHGWLGINSLAVGVLLGAVGQVVLQWYGLRRVRLRPGLRLRHPEVRHIAHLYWPVALGLVITQGQVALDSNLQWITGDKSRAALALATRLFQLPLGIVGTAMSLGSLPTLSTQQGTAFRATLARGLSFVTMLMVPAVVGLYFLGQPFIALAFQHGRFHAGDTLRTTLALRYYLPGLAAAALDQLLIIAFYARQDTRTPVVVGVVSIGAYLLVALVALGPLALRGVPGMESLALADSAKQITHMSLLLVLLWLAQGSLRGTGLLPTVARVIAAGLAMALACLLGLWVAAAWLHGQGLHLAAALVAVAGVASGVYVVALHLLGVSELAMLREGIGRRLRRRAGAGGA